MGHTNYPFEGEPESYLSDHKTDGIYNGQTVGIWNAADQANWNLNTTGKVFQRWSQLSDSVRKYGILCGYLDLDGSFTYLDSNWRNMIYNLQRNYPNLTTMEYK